MARSKKKKYEEEIIQVIEEKKIKRFSHVFLFYTGCSRATAYNYELEKLDTIEEALRNNRETAVNYMLDKWIESENATLQLAAMRIVGEEEDRRKLNQQYIEHRDNSDNQITQIEIVEPQGKKDNNDK